MCSVLTLYKCATQHPENFELSFKENKETAKVDLKVRWQQVPIDDSLPHEEVCLLSRVEVLPMAGFVIFQICEVSFAPPLPILSGLI